MQFIKASLFGKSGLSDQQKLIIKLINQIKFPELTQLVLANRPNFNFCQPYGQKNSPLIIAINAANTEQKTFKGQLTLQNSQAYKIVEFLIKNGADVNLPDCKGRTPLLMACHWNHPVLVQLLLANKADVNSSTQEAPFLNPLFSCLFKKKHNIALLLIQAGADLQKPKYLQNLNRDQNDQVHCLQESSYLWLQRCQNKLKGLEWLNYVREKEGATLSESLQKSLIQKYL